MTVWRVYILEKKLVWELAEQMNDKTSGIDQTEMFLSLLWFVTTVGLVISFAWVVGCYHKGSFLQKESWDENVGEK